MIDTETAIAIAALKNEIEILRAEVDAGRQFPIWHNQQVNHFIPEASAENRVIAFGCTSVGLVITIKVGKVYFKGVSKSIGSTPAGWPNVTITATTYGYLSMSLTDGVVTWGTSASDPGDGDDDTEIFRIFVATVADGKITELLECQHGDIRSMGNA